MWFQKGSSWGWVAFSPSGGHSYNLQTFRQAGWLGFYRFCWVFGVESMNWNCVLKDMFYYCYTPATHKRFAVGWNLNHAPSIVHHIRTSSIWSGRAQNSKIWFWCSFCFHFLANCTKYGQHKTQQAICLERKSLRNYIMAPTLKNKNELICLDPITIIYLL